MQDPVQLRWDGYWARRPADERDGAWLSPFAERLRSSAPLLELGSGNGVDSAVLAGLAPLIALDYSRAALLQLRERVPSARCVLADLRGGLPFADAAFGAIVASLSLHYFDAATTHAILGELRRCLRPSGLLLARVNSDRDEAYGASGHLELEPGLYAVSGRPKRFFDQTALHAFFGARFTIEQLEHAAVGIAPEKWAWTVLARA